MPYIIYIRPFAQVVNFPTTTTPVGSFSSFRDVTSTGDDSVGATVSTGAVNVGAIGTKLVVGCIVAFVLVGFLLLPIYFFVIQTCGYSVAQGKGAVALGRGHVPGCSAGAGEYPGQQGYDGRQGYDDQNAYAQNYYQQGYEQIQYDYSRQQPQQKAYRPSHSYAGGPTSTAY